MSHRERKIQERKTREAKIEEQIKNGTIIRVTYEEKKKKPAIPNRLSPFTTSEEELKDRQETVEKAVKVYYRMLSDLLPKLSRIQDPRKPGKIKHKMKVLIIYGILMSMYVSNWLQTQSQPDDKPTGVL
jgi:3-methyladenine DNA glycosylase/8-oxoguanine DNA glycosylase